MTRYHEPHRSRTDEASNIPPEQLRAMQDRFDHEQEAVGHTHRAAARRADWLQLWGIPLAMVFGASIWALLITWLAG